MEHSWEYPKELGNFSYWLHIYYFQFYLPNTLCEVLYFKTPNINQNHQLGPGTHTKPPPLTPVSWWRAPVVRLK